MEPGLLTAPLVLLCLLLHDVASQNFAKKPKEQQMEHTLLINEVNADNPREDTSEYLELYHTSGQRTSLDGYSVVFYNGKGNKAYKVKDLKGLYTDNQGFLLIGSSTVVPQPAVILPKNTIQNGPDAIALYYGRADLCETMELTKEGLVDALVHKSKASDQADELVRVLTPGVEPFLEDPLFRTVDESLERCQRSDSSQWFFQVGAPTPGLDNHCIPFAQLNASVVLINEFKVASAPDEFEFIELQGLPSTQVKDLLLVLIEGATQRVYFTMEVQGETSPDGLLLLGTNQSSIPVDVPFPQNFSRPLSRPGANAIALYQGSSSSFALGATVSAVSPLDALVYTTVEGTDSKLRDILTPGKPLFHVRERYQQNNTSVSRCACCAITRDSSAYALGKATPRQFNDCPKKRFSQDISLCLQVADCQQEVPDTSMIQASLSQVLDKQCRCGVSPAYFKGPAVSCNGSTLAFTALLAAGSAEQLRSLLRAFSSAVESEERMSFGRWNKTVVKACASDVNGTEMPPGLTSEPPGTTSTPPASPVELLINEVNPDNPGSREDTEFVELFYPGPAPFAMRGHWLVFYNGKNNLAYKVVDLSNYSTDSRGYFLVGSAGVTPRPSILLPDNLIQNGAEAVALYRGLEGAYKVNMPLTPMGLVDAVVYKARGSESASRLLAVLTPGQDVLYENNSHSSDDESLSRCLGLRPRDQGSFQMTEITPFSRNACPPLGSNATEEAPWQRSVAINELDLASSSVVHRFIELKGKPGASLEGYSLVFLAEHSATPYADIQLEGTFGSNGLFLLLAEGQPKPDEAHEQTVIPSWSNPHPQQGIWSVELFGPGRPSQSNVMDAVQALEDAVVYTWEPAVSTNPPFPGPIHFVSRKGEKPVSLSRCPSCTETFALSDPTPGLENRCPQKSLSLDLEICLLTPRLNFTCVNSTLKLSGQVWPRSPEHKQLLVRWQSAFSVSPRLFSVDGRPLKAAACSPPGITALSSGALTGLIALLSKGLSGVFSNTAWRPQYYTNIELNDRYEIMADI
ncbi:General transcription and DNA repair factor IIH helicase subunit XPB [Varanus komodoensis]|nr:General transcription and DNA repair factor IIH helicase subunit XPB [Varanus komodoensis]